MYWNGPQVIETYRNIFTARMEIAASVVVAEMKRATGIQGPPRSKPGNPPHMDTQELNQSITYYVLATDTQVMAGMGSDVPQARWMELGTQPHGRHPGISPRPWCLSSLLAKKDEVRSILGGNRQGAGV